jgi:TolA-binding protein
MRKRFLKHQISVFFFFLTTGVLFPFVKGISSTDLVQLETNRTHSRLKFILDPGVEVEVKNTSSAVEVLFKDISLLDLGVFRSGRTQDGSSIALALADERLGKVELIEDEDGVRLSGAWKFPKGNAELAFPEMEYFEFWNKKEPAFVLDFWHKQGPTMADYQAQKKREESKKTHTDHQQEKKDASLLAQRQIARQKNRAELDDLSHYCKETLSPKRDLFLHFRPFHDEVNFERWLSSQGADRDYPYLEPQGESKEAQYVRLAVNLYRQGKNALVLRTVGFLKSDFPESIYLAEMRFLQANSYIKLNRREEAEKIFQEIMLDHKGSPPALYAGMYTAARAFKSNASLAALEQFLWLEQNYPGHRLAWVFRLGAAESMYRLGQTDRVIKEYEWIANHAPSSEARAEGAFRIGDAYLLRNSYPQALASYFSAIESFPEHAKKFPSVHLNRAESLFWLGEHEKAREAFLQFREQYAGHPEGWRANYRLALIEGHRVARSSVSYQQLLMNTVNEYPYSPGAVLARLRLIPCSDHGGFQLSTASEFYRRAAWPFDGRDVIAEKSYQNLVALEEIRGLLGLGAVDRAFETAVLYSEDSRFDRQIKELLQPMIVKMFRDLIHTRIADGKKYEALAFFQRYSSRIDLQGPPEAFDFLLALSGASSGLRLFQLSENLLSQYQAKTRVQDDSLRSIASEDVNQAILSDDEKATQAWIGLKNSWMKKADGQVLDGFRPKLEKISEGSRYYPSRMILSALILESEAKDREVLSLLKSMMNQTENPNEQRVLLFWLSEVEARRGNAAQAGAFLRELRSVKIPETQAPSDWVSLKSVPRIPSQEDLLWKEAQYYETAKIWMKALEAYKAAAAKGLDSPRLSFSKARALFEGGDTAAKTRALASLNSLVETGEGFWQRMAKDLLEKHESQGGQK